MVKNPTTTESRDSRRVGPPSRESLTGKRFRKKRVRRRSLVASAKSLYTLPPSPRIEYPHAICHPPRCPAPRPRSPHLLHTSIGLELPRLPSARFRKDPPLLERGGKPPSLRWQNASENPALSPARSTTATAPWGACTLRDWSLAWLRAFCSGGT